MRPYLEDGERSRDADLRRVRRSTRAWADCLDRAGIPPGARVAVRLPDPLGYAAALVSILGAGRVAVPLDPAAPAAEVARVLAVARPEAAVSDSGSGLPPGLAVLRPPDRSAGPNRPGRARRCAGTPERGPGRGDLPVHERDHRRAQGHLARARISCATSPIPGQPTTG